MTPVCYLDLDGVIVNFVAGVCKHHNAPLDPATVRWGLEEQMGLTPEVFWRSLDFEFWANLPFTDEAPEVLATVERLFGENVVLLTSPCETVGSVEGKVAWVRNNLPRYKRRLFVGPAKHLLAGPDKILVDDCQANIDKFREHGGRTLLVPRPWNRRHAETYGGLFEIDEFAIELQALAANVTGNTLVRQLSPL